MSIINQQIREIEPVGAAQVTLGATTQTVRWDTTLSAWTDLISFGASEVVTTTPANDPLTTNWITSISITINGTYEVIRQFSRAEYVNIVQNLESKESDLISNGNMLLKRFDPPLAPGTRLQIEIIINTLSNATATPAASCTLRCSLNLYDAQQVEHRKLLTIYQRIPQFPVTPGVSAGQNYQIDLGTEAKTIRWLIIREQTGGTESDTFSGRFELLANGNTVARINETSAKKQYQLISDGLAVPTGYKLLKLPGRGWQATQATTLHLVARAHTTSATGAWVGVQVLEKPYT